MEKRQIIITSIIVLFVIFLGFFFFYKKSCKDEECFNEAMYKCKPATYYGYRNNNLYYYKISRSIGTCRLNIKVNRMAIGTDLDLVRLLEGKRMKCNIPKNIDINLNEMENILNYCSGELKEGLLQLMVERLYALVVRDLSGVVEQAEKLLKV